MLEYLFYLKTGTLPGRKKFNFNLQNNKTEISGKQMKFKENSGRELGPRNITMKVYYSLVCHIKAKGKQPGIFFS